MPPVKLKYQKRLPDFKDPDIQIVTKAKDKSLGEKLTAMACILRPYRTQFRILSVIS